MRALTLTWWCRAICWCACGVALVCAGAALPAAAQDANGPMPLTRRVKVGQNEAYYFFPTADSATPRPVLVVIPADIDPQRNAALGVWRQMNPAITEKGWQLLIPSSPSVPLCSDWGAAAVREMIEEEASRGNVDLSRVYLLGIGGGSPSAFLMASRLPGLWAAAIAIEGSARPAIDTGRLFGINVQSVPMLWVLNQPSQQQQNYLIQKLRQAEFPVNITAVDNVGLGQVVETFEKRQKWALPETVDFETDNPLFGRNAWVEVAGLDPGQRNDVLTETRVKPGSGAALSIGPFGFSLNRTGSGVLVEWLPPDYKGPLKLQDRIVSMRGKPIPDAADYQQMMDEETEASDVALMVERENKRIRVEARVVLPDRILPPTARVKVTRSGDPEVIQVISRGVNKLRLHIPKEWVPAPVNWNGLIDSKVESAGCWEWTFTPDAKPSPCPASQPAAPAHTAP